MSSITVDHDSVEQFLIEVVPRDPVGGLVPHAAHAAPERLPLDAVAKGVAQGLASFGQVLGQIRKAADAFEAADVTIKFGLSVSAEGGIIAKVGGHGSFEVTIRWDRGVSKRAAS